MKKIRIMQLMAIMVVMLIAVAARADVFDLSAPNTAISGYPAPYATVEVTLNAAGTIATFTFTGDHTGSYQYLLGDGGMVALNINASAFTVGTVTATTTGTGFSATGPFSTTIDTNPAPPNPTEDGFGNFNLVIDDFDGFGNAVGSVSFTVTKSSGTWASAADVLTNNSLGYDAAAHIFVTSFPADASNTALATGYAANGTQGVSFPEPATLLLVGTGLIGLAGVGRKRFRK